MASSSSSSTDVLHADLHVAYIQSLSSPEDLAYQLSDHIRLNGTYWALVALSILGREDALDRDAMVAWVGSCWDDKAGAYGSAPGHDGHLHSTLSAVQILLMQDAEDRIPKDRVLAYVQSLAQPSGAYTGDAWGETDTRFTYIAIQLLALLGRLDLVDKLRTVGYFGRCRNFDGGFGSGEGGESHGAQAFVCVAALAILDALEPSCSPDVLGAWLAERQLPSGGLNGRPEKLEDVCYSFWDLSALAILHRMAWIDQEALGKFILSTQDPEAGGFSDRANNQTDVFHTCFALCGLSLLGFEGLGRIDPVFCLPEGTVRGREGLGRAWERVERGAQGRRNEEARRAREA